MPKGTKVLVKSFMDRPLARCVWKEERQSVLICTEDGFLASEVNGNEPMAVSLPKTHIFRYEERLTENLAQTYHRLKDVKLGSDRAKFERELRRLWTHAEPLFATFKGPESPRRKQK